MATPRIKAILRGSGRNYYLKLLSAKPANLIAYWPLWEASGSVANDFSGNARHGAYTGVTLGEIGIGDGRTCPWFDGIAQNDRVNVYSTGLASAVSFSEGSIMVWAKVNSAAVWTDAVNRIMFSLNSGGGESIYMDKLDASSIRFNYTGNGVTRNYALAGLSDIDWMCLAFTWSVANAECKCYKDGVLVQTLLAPDPWTGSLWVDGANIGQVYVGAGNNWHGWLAHAAMWNTPLTETQVANLAAL